MEYCIKAAAAAAAEAAAAVAESEKEQWTTHGDKGFDWVHVGVCGERGEKEKRGMMDRSLNNLTL